MHMVVTTPLGQIKTTDVPRSDVEMEELNKFLEGVNNFNYMQLDTDAGSVYLPKGMIQRSIFALVE